MNTSEFKKFAVHDQGISGANVDRYAQQVENMTQYIIEERPGNFRAIDVFTRLISDRIIFLGMGIDDHIANIVTAQLLFLESTDPTKDIIMYVNRHICTAHWVNRYFTTQTAMLFMYFL